MFSGMQPVKLFPPRLRCLRWRKLPSSAGILPERLLSLSQSSARWERLPNSTGMLPVSWLLLSLSRVRLDRSPRLLGIPPVRAFSPSSRISSSDRSSSFEGMTPSKPLPFSSCPFRLSSVTLVGEPPRVTPSHVVHGRDPPVEDDFRGEVVHDVQQGEAVGFQPGVVLHRGRCRSTHC